MVTTKQNIGKIPIMKGEYQEGTTYQRLNQVTMLGSTYQSKIDGNTSAPAQLASDGSVENINTDKWIVIAVGNVSTAKKVMYDNEESGLEAGNVQGAVDEVASKLSDLVNGIVSYNELLDTKSLNFTKGKNIWIGKGYDYASFDGNLNGLIADNAAWISDFIPNDSTNKEYTLNINSEKFLDKTGKGYIAYIFETDKNSWVDNSVVLQTNNTKYSPKNTGGVFSVSKKYFFIVVRCYNFGDYVVNVDNANIENSNIKITFEKKVHNLTTLASQMQTEQTRVNAELDKKFEKNSIVQELGDAEDKVVSQKAVNKVLFEKYIVNKVLTKESLSFTPKKNIWIGSGYDYSSFNGNLNGLIDDSASWISGFMPNDSINKEYTLNIESSKFVDSSGKGFVAYIFETDKAEWSNNTVNMLTNNTQYSPKNIGGKFTVSKKYFFIVVRCFNFKEFIVSVDNSNLEEANITISYQLEKKGISNLLTDVEASLAKKFDKENIAQELGDAEDKVVVQKVLKEIFNDNILKIDVGNRDERFESSSNIFIDTTLQKSFVKKNKKWFSLNDAAVIDFQNPVCQDAPDPTIINIDGSFYMVSTGRHLMIRKSNDLIVWDDYKLLFGENDSNAPYDTSLYNTYAPQWIKTNDGKIHILIERAGGNNRCYVMTSDSITGDFISDGMLITEEQCALYGLSYVGDNMILEDQDGRFWLYFNTQKDGWNGIHCVELNYDNGKFSLKDTPIFHKCVGGAEGSYCYFKDGYYYLFVSAGAFNSFTYRIEIYRSTVPYGNFISKNGNKGEEITTGEAQGTIILSSNENDYKKSFYGPGHNGEIIIDSNGDYWMIFHSWFNENTVRDMCIMRLKWDEDGYPYFVDDNDKKTTSVQRYLKPPCPLSDGL